MSYAYSCSSSRTPGCARRGIARRQRATVGLDGELAEGQAQTGGERMVACRLVDHGEFFENPLVIRSGDARAVVAHPDAHRAGFGRRAQHHLTAGWSKLERVDEQVG